MFCRCFFAFCVFFVFFPSVKNMTQPFSGTAERIFMKLLPKYKGECSLKRRAAAWRMANVDDLLNFDMTLSQSPEAAITRGRHARRLGYTTMSRRMHVI